MILLISPIKNTTVNYLKDTDLYAALHLACSPKSCLFVYSYKRTSVADGISDRVPLVLHKFFCPPNLAAFIVLKVTKQVTSAHTVQKLQSPAVRSMFRVSLSVFLYLQLLTPHYWSNSRTDCQFMLIDQVDIIFRKFLDYGNKKGEAINVDN
jgi:hypothetical protein